MPVVGRPLCSALPRARWNVEVTRAKAAERARAGEAAAQHEDEATRTPTW